MSTPKRPSRAPFSSRRSRRLLLAIGAPALLAAGAAGWFLIRGPGVTAPAAPATTATLPAGQKAPRPTHVVSFGDGCLTSSCHTSLLTATHVHPPIAEGQCEVCHTPDTGGHIYPLRAPKQELCATCHEIGSHGAHTRATAEDGCLACHEQHTSSTWTLLKGGSVQSTCGKCHVPTQGHIDHDAYAEGRCELCHDPHVPDGNRLLRGNGFADHCARCHEPLATAMADASNSHAKARGECLACHTGHAASVPGLLRDNQHDVCVTCHVGIGATVATAAVTHDAVLKGDQCISCHEPHLSDNPMMLLADQTQVCLKCHAQSVTAHDGRTIPEMATSLASFPVVHGPVAAGECSACHSVHGGNHAKLLNQISPDAVVGTFDVKNFALCFSCHDPGLVLSDSPAATQFRDGTRNLHKLHVKGGDKSRSCSTCHAVHAGRQPRLIVEQVRYEGSDWKAPMGFSLTPEGGRCASACHEPLEYRRGAGNGGLP